VNKSIWVCLNGATANYASIAQVAIFATIMAIFGQTFDDNRYYWSQYIASARRTIKRVTSYKTRYNTRCRELKEYKEIEQRERALGERGAVEWVFVCI